MDRLAAFEQMLEDIKGKASYEAEQMEKLKSEGKEKTATYRQYLGNKLLYKAMLDKYKEYKLIEE